MKRAVMLAVLACVPFPPVEANEAPSIPPLPSSAVPPAEVLSEPIPSTTPLPRRGATAGRPKKEPGPPTIRLGEKHISDKPDGHGAGFIDKSGIKVKADKGTLTVQLTGSVYSHSLWGVTSQSLSVIQLVQEFDVVSDNPRAPRVLMSLSATLVGFVRTEKKAMGGLRMADVVVYPAAGGATSLGLAFPPFGGAGSFFQVYEQEKESGPLLLPAGHYVLVANLVLDTSVESCFRGHAETTFGPVSEYGTWKSTAKVPPPETEKTEEDLGFNITVKAVAPDRD